jgi:hypothetical protein
MAESDIRMEDVGKMMLQNATLKTKDEVIHQFKKFLIKNIGSQYYILLSKQIDYYTVFKIKSASIEEIIENIYSYFEQSYFYKSDESPYVKMSDIKYYEYNDEQNHLELWIDDVYFQLCIFDWGVDEV